MNALLNAYFSELKSSRWVGDFQVATSGGFWVATRANNQRLRKQLKHDREMRNRERKLSLRKDTYLAAAEAISTGITVIGRFADLEIPDGKLTKAYIDKSPAIAKVHVIATEPTVQALTNLDDGLGVAYMRLIVKRIPLAIQKNQISILQQQRHSFSQERDRMLEIMKQFNLDGSLDQRRWEVINENYRFEQKRIDDTSKQQATLFADLSMKHLQLMKECIDETHKLRRLSVPVIVSARTELDMPIDERAYTEIIEQSIKKSEKNIKDLMESINSLITSEEATVPDA